MVVPSGLEPARRLYFRVHRRGTCAPGFTERNGTIHGPVACRPYPFESRQGQTLPACVRPIKSPAVECGTPHADRYISRPTRPVHPLAPGISCARLTPVWKRLYPSPLTAGRVFRFPPRDVKFKLAIICKNGFSVVEARSHRVLNVKCRVRPMFACLKLTWSLLLFFAEIYSSTPYFPFPLPLFPLYIIFLMIKI